MLHGGEFPICWHGPIYLRRKNIATHGAEGSRVAWGAYEFADTHLYQTIPASTANMIERFRKLVFKARQKLDACAWAKLVNVCLCLGLVVHWLLVL